MTQAVQVDDLAAEHKALDRKIREEVTKPSSDDLKIAELKRQKLKLKDALLEAEHQHSH
jgi:hypothetical protein